MAFTETYSLKPIVAKTPVPTFVDNGTPLDGTNGDTTALRGGGFATVVTDSQGFSDVTFFSATGTPIATDTGFHATNAALAQIKSGDVIAVAESNGVVQANTYTAGGIGNGSVFMTSGANPESNADVAALNNRGYVVVDQRSYANGTDSDIQIYIRNAAGAEVKSFAVDTTPAFDSNASVVGLKDGSFAVTWQRTGHDGETSVYYAVYSSIGNIRVGPTLLDGADNVNRAPSVTALADGGFAISYEDNSYDGQQTDITTALINADGSFRGNVQASSLSSTDTQPSATTLSNGLVLTTFTNDFNDAGDTDILAALVDPSGIGSVVTSPNAPLHIDFTGDVTTDSSVAALNLARFAVSYTNATTNAADVATFQLVRTAVGTGGDDTFVGDDAVNVVTGLGGNDTLTGGANNDNINGGAGNDFLYGLGGNDVLTGGIGNDYLDGGAGMDTANYSAATTSITVDLRKSGAQDTGGAGVDTLVSIENLTGGAGADTLFGSSAANRISGGAGNDRIAGFEGADTMAGGAGADTFIYTSVNDSLSTARDKITDFLVGTDKINLQVIDADTTQTGNQAFTFIGTDKFSGVAGQLNTFVIGGNTYLQGDVNGDKVQDFQIQLTGSMKLSASDIIL